MDFRQRLEQNRAKSTDQDSTSDAEESIAFDYYAIDNIKSLPACLDFRLPQGKHKALPYAYFTEISFDNEVGIEILTNSKKVTIIGRDLLKLYDYLLNYRVRFIQTHVGGDPQETGLFVKEIRIEDIG